MPHAQALVITSDPAALGRTLTAGLRDAYEVEWSAEAGIVRRGPSQCYLHSWPEGLRLDAFADDDAALAVLEADVTRTASELTGAIAWHRRNPAVN